MNSYNFTNINKLQADLKSGSIKCADLVEQSIAAIQKRKNLNAFLEIFENTAREQATQIDKKISAGRAGRLAGVIVGLKDNICYKDHHVTASSKILENFVSLFSATVVEKLIAEDAIII